MYMNMEETFEMFMPDVDFDQLNGWMQLHNADLKSLASLLKPMFAQLYQRAILEKLNSFELKWAVCDELAEELRKRGFDVAIPDEMELQPSPMPETFEDIEIKKISVKALIQSLCKELGRLPSCEEIAEELAVPVRLVSAKGVSNLLMTHQKVLNYVTWKVETTKVDWDTIASTSSKDNYPLDALESIFDFCYKGAYPDTDCLAIHFSAILDGLSSCKEKTVKLRHEYNKRPDDILPIFDLPRCETLQWGMQYLCELEAFRVAERLRCRLREKLRLENPKESIDFSLVLKTHGNMSSLKGFL